MVGATTLQWIGWLGFGLGVVLALTGFRGRRTALPYCRHCGHSIPPDTASPGQTCTECGKRLSRPRDIRTSSRRPLIGLIGLILAASSLTFLHGEKVWNWAGHLLLPPYRVTKTDVYPWGALRTSEPRWPEDDFRGLVEVLVDGQVWFRTKIIHPTAGVVRLVRPGPVTPGEQSPTYLDYLWITENPGGSGGYSTTYLFVQPTNGELRPVCTLENGLFQGNEYWIQADVTFRYWMTSGAGSPTPVLTGIPTSEGMRWLDPDPRSVGPLSEYEAMKSTIRSVEPSVHSADMFLAPALRGFLNLVYAGQAPAAWAFLDDCFDAGLERFIESGFAADIPRSREAFRAVLVEKMKTSPFFAEVLRRNGGSIAPTDR